MVLITNKYLQKTSLKFDTIVQKQPQKTISSAESFITIQTKIVRPYNAIQMRATMPPIYQLSTEIKSL